MSHGGGGEEEEEEGEGDTGSEMDDGEDEDDDAYYGEDIDVAAMDIGPAQTRWAGVSIYS